MTTRTATAVIVKATTVNKLDGEERTTYYGPFLPHIGSATTSFLSELESEMEQSGRYEDWKTSIESVFIGDAESDCAVRAAR